MGCTICNTDSCTDEGKDCFGVRSFSESIYSNCETSAIADSAASLRSRKLAGRLNRLQEIIHFCDHMHYDKVGVAYCHSMTDIAINVESELKKSGVYPIMVQCTTGGMKATDVSSMADSEEVSCNPAGQAKLLMQKEAQFIIEIGLCLGHDVIFNRVLDLPQTTLIVKDRVYDHNPARALDDYHDADRAFLESLGENYRMLNPYDLQKKMKAKSKPVILDFRAENLYNKDHIKKSIHCDIKKLPANLSSLNIHRTSEIVLICEGGTLSAYAAVYLFGKGYRNVSILSGGYESWVDMIEAAS